MKNFEVKKEKYYFKIEYDENLSEQQLVKLLMKDYAEWLKINRK